MKKRHFHDDDATAEEAARTPFERKAVMEDLRRMILATADHLALVGAKGRCVDDFLGFEVGPWHVGEIPTIDTTRVDLDRYALTALVNRAYDFAWQVGPRRHRYELNENDYLSVVTYIYAAPTFMSDSSDSPMGLKTSALLQTLEAARARQHLVWGWSISVGALALLARMTEPAARASLSKEEIRTTGEKNEQGLALVSNEDAQRWLNGRRGFVPTERPVPTDDAYLDGDIVHVFHDQGWGSVVEGPVYISGLGTLAKAAEVEADWLLDLIMGGQATLDIDALARVGKHVSGDVPRFVGFAVERLMRATYTEMPKA